MSRNPSVSLTAHQQEFIAELVKSGRYQGVSDVVRAALRLLEEQEERHRAYIARLEKAVEEGQISLKQAELIVQRYEKLLTKLNL